METPTDLPVKKSKRLTSIVWNHFERIRKADSCHAICLHCKKKLSGSSNSGTTHLRNHLIRCLKRSDHDVSQILASKRKRKDSNLEVTTAQFDEGQIKDEYMVPIKSISPVKFEQEQMKDDTFGLAPINLGNVKFDQERSQQDLSRMIMLHGYPLTMVEHVGFKRFVKNLQPFFDIVKTSTVEVDCLVIYGKERQNVYEILHSLHSRISIAVDMWTSSQNGDYLCLTAYYVDEEWKLQKKILNFVTLDISHTDDSISEVVVKCVMDWDVDRMVFSMTFDEFFTNDDMVCKIQDWLSQNKPLLKKGQLFDVRCATYMLKTIALVALKALEDVINKIRESIQYINISQANQAKFYEIAQQVGINDHKNLFVDCPTKWDSTYLMLESALVYKGVFSLLQEQDSSFTVAISEREWEWVTSVTAYTKLLVEVINVFSGNKLLTANIYFAEICDVQVQLLEWCKSSDEFISSMALRMKTKFDLYWKKCSLVLAIAAILDPRFKMKLIEYYYPKIYRDDAPNQIKEISNEIKELFNEYTLCSNSIEQDTGLENGLPGSSSSGTRDRLRGFDKFLHETSQNQNSDSDLDKYLEEPVFPRHYDFNILNWWKVHMPRYPILSMMARDILAIPLSTLGQDLAFGSRGRVLDNNRSLLNPNLKEALICGQDWLRTDQEEIVPSSSHSALPVLVETS